MESHSLPKEDWQSDLDLSSRGRHLLRSGLWADVELAVGENETVIKAHRLVLATASQVFADMLYGPSAEEKSPIRIPDVTLEIFNLLLEFIYTDRIEEIAIETVPTLVNVSKKYLVPRVLKACAITLTKNVTLQNAIQCYQFASTVEYQPLIDECAKFFKFYTLPLLEAGSITDANIDTLEFIFSLDCLSINSELDLLSFVEKHAKANTDEKIEGDTQTRSIRRLLQKIRFFTLEPSELAKQHQRLRAFLTESEFLSLMINYSCEDATPMPEGFTNSRICRKLAVPFVSEIPGVVAVGRVFRFEGIVDENAERFNINLRQNRKDWDGWRDDDGWDTHIEFHMSVRFHDQEDDDDDGVDVVVRNTYADGDWGPEERGGGMPFVHGEQFELTIEVESQGFKICVNGQHFCSYNHRLSFENISCISVKGDVEINCLS